MDILDRRRPKYKVLQRQYLAEASRTRQEERPNILLADSFSSLRQNLTGILVNGRPMPCLQE